MSPMYGLRSQHPMPVISRVSLSASPTFREFPHLRFSMFHESTTLSKLQIRASSEFLLWHSSPS
ncbi:hypothetical protein HanRHA438_Chr07g0297881 [Helianthus annuus]|nr:hypothetical protein HanIR_Chr07g0309911 [Helianthus annuus]KAJ0907349.1 hypothetical protein HanRHA438_Chr07g0297881 [Helianthus annuus]